MDFTFSPEADDAAELAARILTDNATPERMKVLEDRNAAHGGDRFDAELWRTLGEAGLLGLALPEEHGGSGLGLVEACRVIVESGRRVAPVPLASHVAVSHVLAHHGSQDLQAQWLPGAADGTSLLTPALAEDLEWLPATPVTTWTPGVGSGRLRGVKTLVDAAPHAAAYLVTATTGDGPVVVLVAADDDGVTLEPQHTPDGAVTARLTLDTDLPVERVVGGDGAVRALHDLVTLTGAAHLLGVTEGALHLTAGYARTREQFGRPIGTFQAVGQRLADSYIQTVGQRLTLWQAAWRLDEGLDATLALGAAALWAADAAHLVAHTTVHVHGGVGIDMDGEAHRYFTTAKRWEFAHGSSTRHAIAIGQELADLELVE